MASHAGLGVLKRPRSACNGQDSIRAFMAILFGVLGSSRLEGCCIPVLALFGEARIPCISEEDWSFVSERGHAATKMFGGT